MTNQAGHPVKPEDDDDTKTECQKAVAAATTRYSQALQARTQLEEHIVKTWPVAKAEEDAAFQALQLAEQAERQDNLTRAKRALDAAVHDREFKRRKIAEAAVVKREAAEQLEAAQSALAAAGKADRAPRTNHTRQTRAFEKAEKVVSDAKAWVDGLESSSGDAKDGTGDQKMQQASTSPLAPTEPNDDHDGRDSRGTEEGYRGHLSRRPKLLTLIELQYLQRTLFP